LTIRGKLTYNVFEVINLKFSKTELWLIIYALEHEITELYKKLESSNKDYKNEKGEWGISHEQRDKFLHEQTAKILERIMVEINKR